MKYLEMNSTMGIETSVLDLKFEKSKGLLTKWINDMWENY
jgi:hypothetical protein